MTRITSALLVAGALLAGCDSFSPPRVACPGTTLNLGQKLKPIRAGATCAFNDVTMATISYSPQVDPDWALENGEVSELSLANTTVKLIGGTNVLLCAGANCIPDQVEIETKIDGRGTLTYRMAILTPEPPGPGGSRSVAGIVATEHFGPGNFCPVVAEGDLECEEFE